MAGNSHYISQEKKYFTHHGSISVRWQGESKPYYAEVTYNTRANITLEEMKVDIAGKALSVIGFIRRFIPTTDWNILQDMVITNQSGKMIIYK